MGLISLSWQRSIPSVPRDNQEAIWVSSLQGRWSQSLTVSCSMMRLVKSMGPLQRSSDIT